MFGFLKDRTVKCPVCGEQMSNVFYYEVPPTAKREFARMNRYQILSKTGWYHCRDCEIHVHRQVIERANTYGSDKFRK